MIRFAVVREAVIERLEPLKARGLAVQALAKQRNQAGMLAPDSITVYIGAVAPAEDVPVDSEGYQALIVQLVCSCRTTTSQDGKGMEGVSAELRRLLHWWNCPELGRLTFAGFQFTEQVEKDPSYRFEVVFTALVQE